MTVLSRTSVLGSVSSLITKVQGYLSMEWQLLLTSAQWLLSNIYILLVRVFSLILNSDIICFDSVP